MRSHQPDPGSTQRTGQAARAAPRGGPAPGEALRSQRSHGNRHVQGVVQQKLTVGGADDRYEREADRVARQAMSTWVQRAAISGVHGPEAGTAEPAVAQAIDRARGGGRPVPFGVRERMESVTGADLRDVRVHADATADRLNNALSARAFTAGVDVFVRRSEFRPGTAGGDELLAHELTHTIQQGAVRAGPAASGPAVVPVCGVPTAQRVIHVGADPGPLLGPSREKFDKVKVILQTMGSQIPENFDLLLEVSTSGAAMPAAVVTDANGDVTMSIEKWYINSFSVGEIVGMCCHELGVHPLADARLGAGGIALETTWSQAPEVVPGPVFGLSPARTFRLASGGGSGIGSGQRQLDHVSIARAVSPRRTVYEETMLSAGDAIDTTHVSPQEKQAQQQELVKTFLFDVARILVTDDGGPGATLWKQATITEVMQAYAIHLKAQYGPAHAWLQALPITLMKPTYLIKKMVQYLTS